MANRFDELAPLFEEDIKWLRNAAQHFQHLTTQSGVAEESKWALLAACYQERAGMHQALLNTLRNTRRAAGSNLLNKVIGGLGALW